MNIEFVQNLVHDLFPHLLLGTVITEVQGKGVVNFEVYLLRWISLLMKNKLTLRGRVVALMKTSCWEPAVKKTRKLQDVLTAVSNQVRSLGLSYSFSFLHSRKEVFKRMFQNLSLVDTWWQLGKSMIFVILNQVLQTTSGQVVLGHK